MDSNWKVSKSVVDCLSHSKTVKKQILKGVFTNKKLHCQSVLNITELYPYPKLFHPGMILPHTCIGWPTFTRNWKLWVTLSHLRFTAPTKRRFPTRWPQRSSESLADSEKLLRVQSFYWLLCRTRLRTCTCWMLS